MIVSSSKGIRHFLDLLHDNTVAIVLFSSIQKIFCSDVHGWHSAPDPGSKHERVPHTSVQTKQHGHILQEVHLT